MLEREWHRVIVQLVLGDVPVPDVLPPGDGSSKKGFDDRLVEAAVVQQRVGEAGYRPPSTGKVAASKQRAAQNGEPDERVVQVTGERSVGDEDQVTSP